MASLAVNVAVIEAGKVLLTQREDFEYWVLPGGGIEPGESLAQAALRETFEETGLQVALTRLVGIYYRPAPVPWGGHVAVFAARPVGGSLKAQPEEVADLGYFDPAELPSEHMPWMPRRIQDAVSGAGGSAVWRLDRVWPFAPEATRLDTYAWRDRSGLSRADFYRQTMAQPGETGDVLEVPAADVAPWLDDIPGVDETMPSVKGQPGFAVNVAIIQDGRVLLMQREDFEVWGLPGGMVEEGETVAQAARREVFEEVGLEVALTRMVGVYSDFRLYHRGFQGVLFAGRITGGELRVDNREGLQARFFDPGDLPDALQFGTRRRVADTFDGVGGSLLWRQEIGWPFAAGLSRREIYSLRDQSGLGRAEFFRRYLEKVGPLVEELEVGDSLKPV